jgi:hypothetical protein
MSYNHRVLPPRWPLERVLLALAGSVTLLSAVLAALISPWSLALTALVGVNQWLYVLAGACPASMVLKRAGGLRSSLYPTQPRVSDGGLMTAPSLIQALEGRQP